jgi:hypothetical protein
MANAVNPAAGGMRVYIHWDLLVIKLGDSTFKLLSTVYSVTPSSETCQLTYFCSVLITIFRCVNVLTNGCFVKEICTCKGKNLKG